MVCKGFYSKPVAQLGDGGNPNLQASASQTLFLIACNNTLELGISFIPAFSQDYSLKTVTKSMCICMEGHRGRARVGAQIQYLALGSLKRCER